LEELLAKHPKLCLVRIELAHLKRQVPTLAIDVDVVLLVLIAMLKDNESLSNVKETGGMVIERIPIMIIVPFYLLFHEV